MVSGLSLNTLQASVAQSERQVRQDQSRVNQASSELDASRNQLNNDRQQLNDSQQASNKASAQTTPSPAPAINLSRAIDNPSGAAQSLPADLVAPKPQLNSLGQTIGKFINVTA